MPEPTEGPWMFDGLTIYDYNTGLVVARVSMTVGAQDLDRVHVIAASPELRGLVAEVVAHLDRGLSAMALGEWLPKARAALAKAKGETPNA